MAHGDATFVCLRWTAGTGKCDHSNYPWTPQGDPYCKQVVGLCVMHSRFLFEIHEHKDKEDGGNCLHIASIPVLLPGCAQVWDEGREIRVRK